MVQIWPGLFTLVYIQISPGHIWTTLYIVSYILQQATFWAEHGIFGILVTTKKIRFLPFHFKPLPAVWRRHRSQFSKPRPPLGYQWLHQMKTAILGKQKWRILVHVCLFKATISIWRETMSAKIQRRGSEHNLYTYNKNGGQHCLRKTITAKG